MTLIQNYIADLKKTVDLLDEEKINEAVSTLHQARLMQKKIFIMVLY